MRIPERPDELPTYAAGRRVYGEPYQTADGATVVTVTRIRGGWGTRRWEGPGFTATPVGVFVVRGSDASWVPAVDANRVALIGVVTGLVSAVIVALAVLRRPPWPDLEVRWYSPP